METSTGKPASTGTGNSPLDATQCDCVLVVALVCARRNGIRGEETEDTARDFLLHLLQLVDHHPEVYRPLVHSPAWLSRSADNWMKNGLRAHRRRQHREQEMPSDTADDDGDRLAPDFRSPEPSPDTETIRAEFCQRIHSAIASAHLTPAQYDLIGCLRCRLRRAGLRAPHRRARQADQQHSGR